MTNDRSDQERDADTTSSILERAAVRAKQKAVPYAGLVTPSEAHALMQAGVATIVDVRTRFEAEYVGRIPETPLIEWKALGAAEPDPHFLERLEALPDKREHLLFLCRSGVRSHAAAAAATAAGHRHAFNILEGFEGDLDEGKHRGEKSGWRKAGLPWIQS
ncbi:MAG: rhodanese-like domain-containing protein [Burkholderiaceae bacterium]